MSPVKKEMLALITAIRKYLTVHMAFFTSHLSEQIWIPAPWVREDTGHLRFFLNRLRCM